MEKYIESNLGIKLCVNSSPERNATLLCAEVDYAFKCEELPKPKQLFNYINNCQSNCIIRE